jgi:hypothetical protein
MDERDIKAVIQWFKNWIYLLGYTPHYYEIRERVNRLMGFVEVLERELDGQSR